MEATVSSGTAELSSASCSTPKPMDRSAWGSWDCAGFGHGPEMAQVGTCPSLEGVGCGQPQHLLADAVLCSGELPLCFVLPLPPSVGRSHGPTDRRTHLSSLFIPF